MLHNLFEDARRERRRRETEGVRNLAFGTVLGTALGAVLGVLFAPKSGKETRQDISDAATEGVEKVDQTAQETTDNIRLKTDELAETVKTKYDEVSRDVKDKYQEYSDRNMVEINTKEDPNYDPEAAIVDVNIPVDTDEESDKFEDNEDVIKFDLNEAYDEETTPLLDYDIAQVNVPENEVEIKSKTADETLDKDSKEEKDNKDNKDKDDKDSKDKK